MSLYSVIPLYVILVFLLDILMLSLKATDKASILASPLEEHLELRVQIAMLVHFTAGILWLIHKMHVVVWNLQCSMAKRTPWVEEMPVILL